MYSDGLIRMWSNANVQYDWLYVIHSCFPKNREEEQRIKQFEQVRKVRAEYYRKHPHEELNQQ